MGLNSWLALAALVIWGGTYSWYFIGTARVIRFTKQTRRRLSEFGRKPRKGR